MADDNQEQPQPEKRTINTELYPHEWAHVDRLLKEMNVTLDDFAKLMLDHVQQGVYRSGAWERPWLEQVVGCEPIEAAMKKFYDEQYDTE